MINGTQDAQAQTELMNQISKQLESKAALLGGSSKSSSYTKVVNDMNTNIDQSTRNNILKDCIMKQDQDNVLQIFGSDISDANLSQVNEAFVECLQSYDEVRKATGAASGKAGTKEDVKAKSESESLFASSNSLVVVSIVVAILAAILGYVFLTM